MRATSNQKPRNDDNSNPQQGASSQYKSQGTSLEEEIPGSFSTSNSQFKIAPTKRDNRKLFVGGLPAEVTNIEFKEFFEKFGTILDSVVMIDRETKCSRGFGFVTFEDPSIAAEVIKDNRKSDSKSKVNIHGKWCEVKASEPKPSHHQSTYHKKRGNNQNHVRSNGAHTLSSMEDSNPPSSVAHEQTQGFHQDNGYNYPYQNSGNYHPPHDPAAYYMNFYPPSNQQYAPGFVQSYDYGPVPTSQMGQYPIAYPYHPVHNPIPSGPMPQTPSFYNYHNMMNAPAAQAQNFDHDNSSNGL